MSVGGSETGRREECVRMEQSEEVEESEWRRVGGREGGRERGREGGGERGSERGREGGREMLNE